MAKKPKVIPNPAAKEIRKIVSHYRDTEKRLTQLIDLWVTPRRRNYTPLRKNIKKELLKLLDLVSNETTSATRKSYFSAWITATKKLIQRGIDVDKLPNLKAQKLLLDSVRQFNLDYKLVTEEMAIRLDKIVVKGLIQGRPGNIRTGRLIKPIKLTPGNLRNDLIREILKENITLVDSAGRHWTPNRYAQMVARTRTREYSTNATESLLRHNRIGTYKVSTHVGGKDDPACAMVDNRVFRYPWARSKKALVYGVAPYRTPVHPNCLHVETAFVPSGGF